MKKHESSRELLELMRAFDAECREAARKAKTKGFGPPKCRNRGRTVLVSDQAGCMPEQVPEANENLRRLGRTDVKYRPNGLVEYGGVKAKRWHQHRIGLRDAKEYSV